MSSDDDDGARQGAAGSVDGDAGRHAKGIVARVGGIHAPGKIRSASVGALAARVSPEDDASGCNTEAGAALAAVGGRRNTVSGSAGATGTGAGSSTDTFGYDTRSRGGMASADEKSELDDRDGNDEGTGRKDDVGRSNRWTTLRKAFGGRLGVTRRSRGRGRTGGGTRGEGSRGRPAAKKKAIATRIGEMFTGLPLTKLKIVIGDELRCALWENLDKWAA